MERILVADDGSPAALPAVEIAAELAAKTGADSDPDAEILDFAREHAIDLIVVGSRGRGRLPGLVLGSVSQKLASHAPCSVLIAR